MEESSAIFDGFLFEREAASYALNLSAERKSVTLVEFLFKRDAASSSETEESLLRRYAASPAWEGLIEC